MPGAVQPHKIVLAVLGSNFQRWGEKPTVVEGFQSCSTIRRAALMKHAGSSRLSSCSLPLPSALQNSHVFVKQSGWQLGNVLNTCRSHHTANVIASLCFGLWFFTFAVGQWQTVFYMKALCKCCSLLQGNPLIAFPEVCCWYDQSLGP